MRGPSNWVLDDSKTAQIKAVRRFSALERLLHWAREWTGLPPRKRFAGADQGPGWVWRICGRPRLHHHHRAASDASTAPGTGRTGPTTPRLLRDPLQLSRCRGWRAHRSFPWRQLPIPGGLRSQPRLERGGRWAQIATCQDSQPAPSVREARSQGRGRGGEAVPM